MKKAKDLPKRGSISRLRTAPRPLVEGISPGKDPIPEAIWIEVPNYDALFEGERWKKDGVDAPKENS